MLISAWVDGERECRRQKQGKHVQTYPYSAFKSAAGSSPAASHSALPLCGTELPACLCPLLLLLVLPVHGLEHLACFYHALGVRSPRQGDRWARICSRMSFLDSSLTFTSVL